MKAILNKLCAAKEMWSEFIRCEDKKYFAEPVGYKPCHKRYFLYLNCFFVACLLIWFCCGMLK